MGEYKRSPVRRSALFLSLIENFYGGVMTPVFLFIFLKKKKAGGVSTFFVFGDTSHLFCLCTYYNAWEYGINRQCATNNIGTYVSNFT